LKSGSVTWDYVSIHGAVCWWWVSCRRYCGASEEEKYFLSRMSDGLLAPWLANEMDPGHSSYEGIVVLWGWVGFWDVMVLKYIFLVLGFIFFMWFHADFMSCILSLSVNVNLHQATCVLHLWNHIAAWVDGEAYRSI